MAQLEIPVLIERYTKVCSILAMPLICAAVPSSKMQQGNKKRKTADTLSSGGLEFDNLDSLTTMTNDDFTDDFSTYSPTDILGLHQLVPATAADNVSSSSASDGKAGIPSNPQGIVSMVNGAVES